MPAFIFSVSLLNLTFNTQHILEGLESLEGFKVWTFTSAAAVIMQNSCSQLFSSYLS